MFSYISKTHLIFLLVICFKLASANSNTPPSSKRLKKVYTYNYSTKDRLVLKLYEDCTYEFINFRFKQKRKHSFRESGKYQIKNQLLILTTKSANKNFEHPFVFDILENNVIKKHLNFFSNKSFKDIVFNTDSSLIYYSHSYKDSIFGTIYNDYFLPNKFYGDQIQIETKKITPTITKVDLNANELNKNLKCTNTIKAKPLSSEYCKKLKVVLLVGPIGKNEEDVKFEKELIEDRKKIATYLKSLGVQVVEIYPPNSWKEFINASRGAHVFIYAGHGSIKGDNYTGGICLNDGIASSDDVRRDLKLHKNALVIFNHVCGGAGSSAIDPPDIGISEATQRVIDYSRPFFDIGVSTYFADNMIESRLKVVQDFLSGKTLEEIYIDETKNWFSIDLRIPTSNDKNKEIAISSDTYIKNRTEYAIAYVGSPCFTIWDVFNK